MRLYGVVDTRLLPGDTLVGDTIDVSIRREYAESMVEAWNRDEPEDAGALEVVEVEFGLSAN